MIQTDHVIEDKRLDLVNTEKKGITCQVINFVTSYDTRVNTKEIEKIVNY